MTDATPDETAFKPLRKPWKRHPLAWTKERKEAATRSRVSNGKDVLAGIDGRSSVARRFRDVVTAVVQDLGGPTECSAALLEIVKRFAATVMLAEALEARLINGQPVNAAEHALLSSTLCRLSSRIGIRRLPRSLQTPSLKDYFDLAQQPPADDDEAS